MVYVAELISPMTADVALQLGAAAGSYFHRDNHEHGGVIGKDTRLSDYIIETALTAGFLSTGMDLFLPSPMLPSAVAYLTHSLRADVGVMISARYNPTSNNGIKFFDPNGFKLSDEAEATIFAYLRQVWPQRHPQLAELPVKSYRPA